MGCCSSKANDDTAGDVRPTVATNIAASPETNISTPSSDGQVSHPTKTGITQFESSGRARGYAETIPMRPAVPTRRPTRRSTPKAKRPTVVGGFNQPETPDQPPFPPLPSARSRRGSASTQPDEANSPPEVPRQATIPPPPPTRSRRTSVSAQPDEALKSDGHSSWVRQSAPGGSHPASTEPAIKLSHPSNDSTPQVAAKALRVANIEGAERPFAQYRRRSVSAPSHGAFESKRRSKVKQSASVGSLPASTDPGIKFPPDSTPRNWGHLGVDELRDGFLRSGKRSERLDTLDYTSKLAGRSILRGQGGFSDVTQAKLGDRLVAVKALRIPDTEDSERRLSKRLAREIYVWAELDHPNVLELLGFAFEDGRPCLISPWCDNGTLNEFLQKFPDANRRRLVREVAEGLRYLHELTPPIIHGDVKPTNVLVTDEHVAKICDFGTSRRVEELRTGFTTGSFPVTLRYGAPEVLQQDSQHSTWCSDVFSFAYIVLETMTDKCPFWRITSVVAVITRVVLKHTPSPEDHPGMEDVIWELLRRCWNYEPKDRPKMIDVCQTLAGAGY